MILVGSGSAVSVAANTRSAQLITGQYEFLGKGRYFVVAKSSATGMRIDFSVGGTSISAYQPIAYTGTAGTISTRDNVVCEQILPGGRVELYLSNTTGGALTTDYFVYFEPLK